MPLKLYCLASYEACLKKLGRHEKEIAGVIIFGLLNYFTTQRIASGSPYVFQYAHRSHRLVFKKLQGFIWEAYVEGDVRILTRFENNSHYLVFAGNHDQVREFLKEA